MANLGEEIQLHNADGTVVNPNMWITINRTGYTQSDTNISFNFQAVLRIKISTGTYYNNKIKVKLQIPSSESGDNWYEYEIKPQTSDTPAATYTSDSNGWVVPMSAGAFSINVIVWDAQNSSWTTGTYTFTSDMPIVVTPPTVGDLSFSNITSNSATASFAVTDTGYGTVNGYQFDVTTDSTFQTGVTSHTPGSPSINLTSLTRYTTYWVRSRASNEAGWGGWNGAKSFATLPTAPTISALSVSKITFGSITASFSVSDTGGPALTATVIQASRSSTFASGVKTINGTSGTFNGLDPGAKYYLRAYATNASNLTSITPTVTKNTKEYNPPTSLDSIKVELEIIPNTGGPNEDGDLIEPIATSTFMGSWTEPGWGSADEVTTEGTVKKGFNVQWVKMTKVNGEYVDSNYGGAITIDANSLVSKREASKTLNRTDFKPGDKIRLKVQPFSEYNGISYIPMSNELGLWVSSNSIEIVVKRFVQVLKPGEKDFKYERIYISKNGSDFIELEQGQTFNVLGDAKL